jgi:hypothetical protein
VGKFGRRVLVSVLAGAVMLSVQGPVVSAAAVVRTTGGVLPFDHDWPIQQDPKLVNLKRDGRLAASLDLQGRRRPMVLPHRISAPPPALTLSTRDSARFVEPPGYGTDDNGKNYVDANYWNFCSAGAATVAASYFISDPVQLTGAFREPYGPYSIGTHWDAADVDSNLGFNTKARAFMLFMAMQVQPPSFDSPGIDDFRTYPTGGGSPQGIRDAINWEISGHLRGGRWATYFYFTEENSGPGFSPDQMNADIVADIAGAGAPVVVAVDADYLPNWPDLARPLHHAITIVGYDNINDTYTYVDTCGRQCGSLSNGGTHVMPQAKLFKAVQMVGRADSDGYLIKRADGLPKYPNGAYIW